MVCAEDSLAVNPSCCIYILKIGVKGWALFLVLKFNFFDGINCLFGWCENQDGYDFDNVWKFYDTTGKLNGWNLTSSTLELFWLDSIEVISPGHL